MITRLRVRNLKSLKDLDIELGPVNVFVGPNMSGKSTVMDVFRFIFDLLHPNGGQQGLYFALNNRGVPTDLLWKGGGANIFSIGFEGDRDDEPGTRWAYELSVSLPPNGFFQLETESLKLNRNSDVRELIGVRPPNRFLRNYDGKELAGISSDGRSALQSRIANWDGDFLARLIDGWRFYQFIAAAMKNPNPTGIGQVLDSTGSNVSAWLMWLQTHHPDQFAKINQAACDILPGFKQLVTSPTQQGTVFLSSRETGLAGPVNLWGMSDGELTMLALLSLIYSPVEWAGGLYCIDEPENHLYPKLLGSLLKLLRQVREETVMCGLPLSQIMMATQSPELVDMLSLDEIVWLQKKNGATVAMRPRDRKHLRDLVSDKELGLADIVYSGMLSASEE